MYGNQLNKLYASTIHPGDEIEMRVDLSQKTLSYKINDKNYGTDQIFLLFLYFELIESINNLHFNIKFVCIAYENITHDIYRMATTLCISDDSDSMNNNLELIDYIYHPEGYDTMETKEDDNENENKDDEEEEKKNDDDELDENMPDSWSLALRGQDINTDSFDTLNCIGLSSIFGIKKISKGVHHWKFKIITMGQDNYSCTIGISNINDCTDDYLSSKFKGFGFISFDSNESMQNAIQKNGEDFKGRPVRINEAKPKGN